MWRHLIVGWGAPDTPDGPGDTLISNDRDSFPGSSPPAGAGAAGIPSAASALPLAGLGALLAVLTLSALALHIPGADTVGTDLRKVIFVGLLGAALPVYFAAVRLSLRAALPGSALWIVLGVAALLRLALLPADPFLSSDIYRYVWDGQVQAAGINPYRYVPADPALAGLRDPAIFPHINRATYARTIYPPAAQMVFAAVGRLSGSVIGMKAAMLVFETITVLALLRLLGRASLPPWRVLIYAWNPLVLWSFACDGHVDAVAIALLALGLLVRARRRTGLAGAILALATLVKFLPIAVAPAFLIGAKPWRPALAGALVVAVLYGAYSSAGANVIGFLPAYGSEEGLAGGGGFWLLAGLSTLVRLPAAAGPLYSLAVMAGFAALSFMVARGGLAGPRDDVETLCRGTAILAAAATVAISPHYPWYFAWLALPCAVAPIPAVIWLSAAPVLLYIDPLHERFIWPSLVYLPAAALMVGGLRAIKVPAASVASRDDHGTAST